MARITCPACSADLPDSASTCPKCGKTLQIRDSGKAAPISHLGGKLQVIGTVILAGGIISTVTGGWWGPALLFPGLVLFILGRFW